MEKKMPAPKIQFYTHLALIRKRYEEGVVFASAIYDELVAAKKISMSYKNFTRYFNIEIKKITHKEHQTVKTSVKEITVPAVAEVNPKEDNDGPLIFSVGGKGNKKPFNPHAHGIDPSRIL